MTQPEQGRETGRPSPAARARAWWRAIEKTLARNPVLRVAVSVPQRTARFAATTVVRRWRAPVPGLPVPGLSPSVLLQVAVDEATLSLVMGPNRFPRRAEYEQVAAELAAARVLFDAQGWLADPASYHRRPPPLTDPEVAGTGWAMGLSYERLRFTSGFEPRVGEPGREHWASYEPNRTAWATVVRHRDRDRPWVVALHGFGMGQPFMDFVGLHVARLHRELGLNVVVPTLPLHGPRKVTRFSGEVFLSFDLMATVHAMTHTMWDVRRLLSWLRTQGAPAIGVYGISLGGYAAALLAALEELDCVIAGVPVSDFPALFHAHSPRHIRLRAAEHEILRGNAEIVHRVIGPLAMSPLVAPDRRFIYAGLADRMSRPQQAHALWEHWGRPDICWYPGNHIGFLIDPTVTEFVRASLTYAGLADLAPPDDGSSVVRTSRPESSSGPASSAM